MFDFIRFFVKAGFANSNFVSHCGQIIYYVYNEKHMPAPSPTTSKELDQQLRVLGQHVRQRRKQLEISSTIAAEASGMSRTTLYRIEKGEASVTMGAYLGVIAALGLALELVDPKIIKAKHGQQKIPSKIGIANYKQLKKLAWQLKDSTKLTPKEALNLYERNWRHLDTQALDQEERKLIEMLLKKFKRKRLLV